MRIFFRLRASLNVAWSSWVETVGGGGTWSGVASGYLGRGGAVAGEDKKEARDVTWNGERSLTLHLS